ncbi:hypothetical protein MTR_1g045467 [Medicago truncatula]|uniref:Uncharacterized protein n=1 Tax=Medicago truncatula TaxID=3880 RepID=A0A072VH63_MEDTR|nr:hypothetical protein MTR_1g045467 [Medicago truncatula]
MSEKFNTTFKLFKLKFLAQVSLKVAHKHLEFLKLPQTTINYCSLLKGYAIGKQGTGRAKAVGIENLTIMSRYRLKGSPQAGKGGMIRL